MNASDSPALAVEALQIEFASPRGPLVAVDGVSFSVDRSETLALVGESGCGKSVTALSILGLLPKPAARAAKGQIFLHGEDLLALDESGWQRVRGNRVSMIFQEPMTALNPVMRIGDQIAEVLLRHQRAKRSEATGRAIELLESVRISDPLRRSRHYPHQLSGGMRQRVMIAIAIACEPAVLVADEPTTALDVTVQAEILDLITELKYRQNSAVLLITHDLGVVAQFAQRVAVMYAGRIVETANVGEMVTAPLHPYTRGLIRSIPVRGRNRRTSGDRLQSIEGKVPRIEERGVGCNFRDRCVHAIDRCAQETPLLSAAPGQQGRNVACLRANETGWMA